MQDLETRTENLAKNEILGNQSALVEALLASDHRMLEELTGEFESYQWTAEEEGWRWDKAEQVFIHENGYREDSAADWAELCDFWRIDPEPKEVMEWWWIGRTGARIAEDLEEVGAVLVRHPDTDDVWWGRTETGQALAYDSDLRAVVHNLETKVAQL